MRFPVVIIVLLVIAIGVVAFSVWLWMELFQKEDHAPQAIEICTQFEGTQENVSCKQAVSVVTSKFPGKANQVQLMHWSDLEFPSTYDTRFGIRFWKIDLTLSERVQYLDYLVEGDIEVLVDVDTERTVLYKFDTP